MWIVVRLSIYIESNVNNNVIIKYLKPAAKNFERAYFSHLYYIIDYKTSQPKMGLSDGSSDTYSRTLLSKFNILGISTLVNLIFVAFDWFPSLFK